MKKTLITLMTLACTTYTSFAQISCAQLTPPLVELLDTPPYEYCIETPPGVYQNPNHHAKSWTAATSIDLNGINPYLPTEFNPYGFQANIVAAPFTVSLLTPGNDNTVEKWGKVEYALGLPPAIAAQVNNFVNNLPGTKTNPYLEWELKVSATFYHGATTVVRDGFYTKDYTATYPSTPPSPANGSTYTTAEINTKLGTWTEIPTTFPFRVRFSPPETGDWSVLFTVTTPNASYTSPYFEFKVIDTGKKPPISIGTDKRYFVQDGKTFIPSGCNLGWPESDKPWTQEEHLAYSFVSNSFNNLGITPPPYFYQMYRNHVLKIHQSGGNFFRFIMSPISAGIEFEKLGDYTERLSNAYEMDKIVELAEQNGMYIDWNFFIHTLLQVYGISSNYWDWQKDPNTLGDVAYCYNSAIANDNNHPINVLSFFINPDAKKYYKQRLRYVIARWGYSPHIAMFELMSEISNTGKDYADQNAYLIASQHYEGSDGVAPDAAYIHAVYSWESEMADYLKNTLHVGQLLAPSYAVRPKVGDFIFDDPNIDIKSVNDYDYDVSTVDFNHYRNDATKDLLNLKFDTNQVLSSSLKPRMYSEMAPGAVDMCNHIETNRNIWKMLFSGFATALDWNQMTYSDNMAIYGQITQFMQGYDLEIGDYWLPGNINKKNDGSLEKKIAGKKTWCAMTSKQT